ncbi:MAG TPA: peptidyl-prolyl cis-trans isomerase [Stellaceae bacterium]|nr:peptidyl-prolyl cis-trans isomerase [Stellaceae bacterium]
MLQAIRSRGASLVVKGLFAVLIATFVVWGIGDIFRLHGTQQPIVATVDGEEITAQDLQNALQPALERLSAQLGKTFDLKQAKQFGIVDAVLAQLIDRALADRETEKLRLDVSDDVIRGAILGDPSFRTPNGAFDRTLFNEVLARNNLTEDQFVDKLRRDIPRLDLYRAITAGVAAPPALLDLIYRYQNEKRIAAIVPLPTADAGDVGTPSAAELEKFYEAHQGLFRAPEYRGFTVASLVPDDIAKDFKIPDAQLKQEYEESRDNFVLPERRQVEQILAPSEAKAKAAEAALAAGKTWKEVATTIAGQDPATIDLGLVRPQDLPKPLSDAVFALPQGKPSQPIESPLGWHILRVTKIVPPTTESFAEAKPKLARAAARSAAADRIETIGNHVDDALAGGMSLDAAAKKFGLKTTAIAAADEHGMTPDGKPASLPIAPNRVLQLAFAADQGQASRVYHTDDGGIFVIRVDKITPPHVRPLAEVKAQAIAAWQADARRRKVDAEAKALLAAVKGGAPLAAAAAQKGLKATTSPPLLRHADGDAGVPPPLVAKLFAVKPGAAVTIADGSGAYVAQLEKVEIPKAPKPTDTAALADATDMALKADLAAEFTASLRRQYPVEIHRDTLDRLF